MPGRLPMWLVMVSLLCPCCGAPPSHPLATAEHTADGALDALLDELHALELARDPLWASSLGERDLDARLADTSVDAVGRYRDAYDALADRVEALDPDALSPTGRDARRTVAAERLRVEADRACRPELWSLDTLRGPLAEIALAARLRPMRSLDDLDALVARFEQAPRALERHLVALQTGVAEGYLPLRASVVRMVERVEPMLDNSTWHHPELTGTLADDPAAHDRRAALESVVAERVRPALRAYRDALNDDLRPAARETPGVAALPDGAACYRASIAAVVGEGHSPESLHALGLALLDETQTQWRELGAQAVGDGATDAEIRDRLASRDASVSEDEVLESARDALRRADGAALRVVARIPTGTVEVRRFAPQLGAQVPLSVYQGAPAGEVSAWYLDVDGLTREGGAHLVEALAFHETLPGHHLQDALAAELDGLHPWQRRLEQPAFAEGWALYAERLADELDLYDDAAARLGMLELTRWRAARLVVDTGMHAMGWSRARCIDLLVEHAPLSRAQAALEVDRQAARPGQALAYVVGWRAISGLRAEAETALGDCFELRAFHDEVLSRGPIPLALLEERVRDWISTVRCGQDGG